MCLLMVVGTSGPCRVFPLPPTSIEPLFITRHAGETKHSFRISRLSCHLACAKWILGEHTMNERHWGGRTRWDVLTWHKRISKVIACAKKKRERRDNFDASNNRQVTFPSTVLGLVDKAKGLQFKAESHLKVQCVRYSCISSFRSNYPQTNWLFGGPSTKLRRKYLVFHFIGTLHTPEGVEV